jgi:hypothetical protein
MGLSWFGEHLYAVLLYKNSFHRPHSIFQEKHLENFLFPKLTLGQSQTFPRFSKTFPNNI